MDTVKINPQMLQWAMERANISGEQLAKRVGKSKKQEIVFAWEIGEAQPTFRQTQELSHIIHIPTGYTYSFPNYSKVLFFIKKLLDY